MKFKLGILLTFIIFHLFNTLQAETVQKGIVKEYNEKAQKTPLPGVELNIRQTNNTVSDKNGSFTLSFLSLQPGEKINVRRIEKFGYEVFNKEAIEQWNLNPKSPFIIVMCKSDKFKQIRDNYERISSESYAKQRKKEEDSLAKLKAEGKLKEAEYQKRLIQIKDDYEDQLENLQNYIDRFSRIDLSEISAAEQEIIQLIQEGKIDEAIARYENQNYLDIYKKETAEIKKLSIAIGEMTDLRSDKTKSRDSVGMAIDRQIDAFKLGGGKENFNKIKVLLHELAYCDTTDFNKMYKYGEFLFQQKDYVNALTSLYTAFNNCTDSEKRIKIMMSACDCHISLSQFQKAETIISEIIASNNVSDNDVMARLYLTLGSAYFRRTLFDKARLNFDKALEFAKDTHSVLEGNIFFALSSLNRTQKNFEDAKDFGLQAKNLFESINDSSGKHSGEIAKCESNLAKIDYYSGKYDSAYTKFVISNESYAKLFSKNPSKYEENLAWNQVMTAKALFRLDKFEEALSILDNCLETYNSLYKKIPYAYGKSYSQALDDYGVNLIKLKRFDEALKYYGQSTEIVSNLFELDSVAFRPLYAMNYYAKAYRAYQNDDFDESIKLNERTSQLLKPLFEKDPRTYGDAYFSTVKYLSDSYWQMGDLDSAYDNMKNCVIRIEDMDRLAVMPSNSAEIYRRFARFQEEMGMHKEAISSYRQAFQLYVGMINKSQKHLNLALSIQRNISAIYDYSLSDYDGAEKALKDALEIKADDNNILEDLGKLYIKQNKYNDASDILKRLVAITPNYESKSESEFNKRCLELGISAH